MSINRQLLIACLSLAATGCPDSSDGTMADPGDRELYRGDLLSMRELPTSPETKTTLTPVAATLHSIPEHQVVLEQSKDPQALEWAARALAASEIAKAHSVLGQYLQNGGFLQRLDTQRAYQGTYAGLRLARVMRALGENRLPSSDALLLQLIDANEFQQHVLRIQLLIRTLAAIQPTPDKALDYWDRLSNPASPITYDVIEALSTNQSEPALALLKEKLLDPNHEYNEKLSWMRELILPHRNDTPLLRLCRNLLESELTEALKAALVEALFDFRPSEWYIDPAPSPPPPHSAANRESKKLLRTIGESALQKIPLNASQKAAVKKGLEEL